MKMNGWRLERISKTLGGRALLCDVDLALAPNETLALLGPTGAGKTTLLRILAGLEPATSGRVLHADADWSAIPPHRRQISMVFQEDTLWPSQTVARAFALAGQSNSPGLWFLRKRTPDDSPPSKRAREWIDRLGLAPLLSRRCGELSGGERRKVTLALALSRDPQLLLLDEPLTHLDPVTRDLVRQTLRQLRQQRTMAQLLVTHDPLDAWLLADRIAILEAGQLLQVGRPSELLKKPASLTVTRLLSSVPVNSLVGVIATTPAGRFATGPWGQVLLPAGDFRDTDSITLSFRPETARLTDQPCLNGLSLPAKVVDRLTWIEADWVEMTVEGERLFVIESTPTPFPMGASCWINVSETNWSLHRADSGQKPP